MPPMPRITIGLGVVLIIIGVIAYIATQFATWNALVPTILGILVLTCGVIALKQRQAGLIAGVVVAIIGFVAAMMNAVAISLIAGVLERPAVVVTGIITCVLLGVFLPFCLKAITPEIFRSPPRRGWMASPPTPTITTPSTSIC